MTATHLLMPPTHKRQPPKSLPLAYLTMKSDLLAGKKVARARSAAQPS